MTDIYIWPTAEKLAAALEEIHGIPPGFINEARSGHYHDYASKLAMPITALIARLLLIANHPGTPAASRPILRDLAEKAKDGEFDATKEEADAWAKSPEGQETFAELIFRNTGPRLERE